MTPPIDRDVLRKVRKLAQLPEEMRHSQWAIAITRLTVLKSLCKEPDVANRFVTFLARKTLERVQHKKGRPTELPAAKKRAHQQLMTDALAAMEAWIQHSTDAHRHGLWELLSQLREEQNEFKHNQWGAVRIITDWNLLIFEDALHCLANPAFEAGHGAYQTARDYAEGFNSRQGSGLVSSSAPKAQDIADFWIKEFGLDAESLTAPAPAKSPKTTSPSTKTGKRPAAKKASAPAFTHRQGQFLAFIHLYCKLHRKGPSEKDMVMYFRVTPPTVHGMIVKLEERGLVTREQGVARSVRVAIPEQDIPELEERSASPR